MANGTCDAPGCPRDSIEEDLTTGVEMCEYHIGITHPPKPGRLAWWQWLGSDGWRSQIYDHDLPSTMVGNLKTGNWTIIGRMPNGQKVVYKCRS